MPTIEEVITKLKENDEEAAGVVSTLLQAHDNFKTQSRRWEDQAKQNKDDAEKFRQGQTGNADLEKANEELKAQLADKDKLITEKDSTISGYEQKETRGKLLSEVAGTAGIPAHLHDYLRGDTKEELEASAEKVKRDFKFGNVEGFGNDQQQPSKGTLDDGKALYEDYNKK